MRPAKPGFTFKTTLRPDPSDVPGGMPDGTYLADYAFTDAGDLDACNGRTVDGQYGYYVTNSYPLILSCLRGTREPSFDKRPR